MKKIKFIPLILIAIALVTTSCAIDDDDAIVPRVIVTKTVSLTDVTDVIVAKSDSPYGIGLTVDISFGTNALVEYSVNEGEGGATIAFGSTSGSIDLNVSVAGTYMVTLTNVSVLNKPDTVDAVIDDVKKVIKVTVLDVVADPSALQVILDWENPAGNDLDLYITDEDLFILESSLTITPMENVSFANSDYGDATYNVIVNNWSSSDTNVAIQVYIIHPDGNIESFEGVINNIVGGAFYYFVNFDKVGDAYTTTQVPIAPVF